MPTRKAKAKPVDVDDPIEPIEKYAHGSLARGDVPPAYIAAAIANTLRDNPYRDTPPDELEALAREFYRAVQQLRLVERVLQARNAAW